MLVEEISRIDFNNLPLRDAICLENRHGQASRWPCLPIRIAVTASA